MEAAKTRLTDRLTSHSFHLEAILASTSQRRARTTIADYGLADRFRVAVPTLGLRWARRNHDNARCERARHPGSSVSIRCETSDRGGPRIPFSYDSRSAWEEDRKTLVEVVTSIASIAV